VAVLLLAAGEIALRMVGGQLSEDIRHIRSIPEIAAELGSSDLPRILFLGNSLTRRGIDEGAVKASLAAGGCGPVEVKRVFPDDTTVTEWFYILKHDFVDTGREPNVLVLPFVGSQLQDWPISSDKIARIGCDYMSLRELPDAFESDFRSFDDRTELLLSHVFLTFARREHIGRRILDVVVPHYRVSSRWANKPPSEDVHEDGAVPRYERLKRLLTLARSHTIEVVVVAMPLSKAYSVREKVARVVLEEGGVFLDARNTPGLSKRDYLDGYHLSPNGAEVFSRFLGTRLVEAGIGTSLSAMHPGTPRDQHPLS